jgi:hypothetical protein
MAMSTMLYNENPPLRNELPVNLSATSPLPGRARQEVRSIGLTPLQKGEMSLATRDNSGE